QVLTTMVRGMDLDPDALSIARAALLARSWELGLKRPVAPQLTAGDALNTARHQPLYGGIIMNPPYANADRWPETHHRRLADRWPFYRRQLDQSVCFIAAAVEMLAPGGTLAAIVPRYWLEATGAAQFRRWLTHHTQITQMLDLGNVQVWPTVHVLTALLVLQRTPSPPPATSGDALFWRAKTAQDVDDLLLRQTPVEHYNVPRATLTQGPWVVRPPQDEAILEALTASGTPCQQWFRSGQGLKTGLNRVFVLDCHEALTLELPETWLAPLVKARDLQPCRLAPSSKVLLQLEGPMELTQWPTLMRHLKPHRKVLEARYQFRHGACPWYGLALPQNMAWMGRAPKVLTPLYARHNRFALDRIGYSVLTDIYMLVPRNETGWTIAPEALVALLNSAPLRMFAAAKAKLKRDGYHEYGARLLRTLPLPLAADSGQLLLTQEAQHVLDGLAKGPTTMGAEAWLTWAHNRAEEGDAAHTSEVDRLVWALFGFKKPPQIGHLHTK
ncbi:MAG: TaqI-like C-terminal specificity domain-containing protein, partial [Myxococcota bacterium]